MSRSGALGWLSVALAVSFLVCQLRYLYSLAALALLRRRPFPELPPEPEEWPRVVVQLAVYLEHRVLEPLVETVIALDYPKDALRVQVLDDSPEDEAGLSREIVNRFARSGVAVEYHHRGTRRGYKAGALNYGLAQSDEELVAYFDADCRPRADFLKKTVPFLADPEVAAVQARWDYTNARKSPLTALQAAVFEGLFFFEMAIRAKLGSPVFYMGSAAVWRRRAILELGGFQESPFTAEDLDLAYRAGSAGFRVLYQPEVLADSDAVESYLAYKAQQRRWARAIVQTAIDNWAGVARATWGPAAKWTEATTLLLHAAPPLLLAASAAAGLGVLASVPRTGGWLASQWTLTALTILPPSALSLMVSQRGLHRDWRSRAVRLARSYPFVSGLMWSLAFGIWDALRRSKREFVVTPKQGETGVIGGSRWRWLTSHLAPTLAEALFGFFCTLSGIVAVRTGYLESSVPLLALGLSTLSSFFASSVAVLRQVASLRTDKALSGLREGARQR